MRFEILYLLAVLVELSLLILALALLAQPAFRSKAYWLLAYVITALNSDYATAMVKIDRALGRDGALWRRVTLPADINYLLDVFGRCALLIAIWLFLMHLMKTRTRKGIRS